MDIRDVGQIINFTRTGVGAAQMVAKTVGEVVPTKMQDQNKNGKKTPTQPEITQNRNNITSNANKELMDILKPFDQDGNGVITEVDFVLIARQLKMGNIGEQLARAAFRDCDKNGNGILDFNESFAALKHIQNMFLAASKNPTDF